MALPKRIEDSGWLRLIGQAEGLRIPILSEILGYAVPRQKILIGLYEPAAHWLSLILTMASVVLREGYVVNIVTTATSPAEIRKALGHTIPNLSELEVARRLIFSDWFTWLTGKKSDEAISVDTLSIGKMSLEEMILGRQYSPSYDFVVADSFSTFLKYNDERTFMQWFDRLVARLRPLKGIRLYGFVKGFHSETLYSNVQALADGVIELNYRESGGKLENAIRIKSLKGMSHPTEWRSLEVNPDGTLRLSR